MPPTHPPATVWHVWPCLLLQVPAASQVPTHESGSSAFLTATHALPLQVWQAPVQSAAAQHPVLGMHALPQRFWPAPQQRPLAQLAFWHMVADVQAVPSACLAVQTPFAAQYPLVQSPSPPQVPLHVVVDAQTSSPGHDATVAAWQAPLPSQARAEVNEAPLHIAAPHEVPAGGTRHAPLPSHVPGRPHGGALSFVHWP